MEMKGIDGVYLANVYDEETMIKANEIKKEFDEEPDMGNTDLYDNLRLK